MSAPEITVPFTGHPVTTRMRFLGITGMVLLQDGWQIETSDGKLGGVPTAIGYWIAGRGSLPIDQARTRMLEHALAERPHCQPMMARCRRDDCDHHWPVCYLPMPLDDAARCMKHAICPKCADDRPLVGGTTG